MTKALSLVQFIFQLVFNYFYDFFFYLRNSKSIKLKNKRNDKQLIGEIIKLSHSLEKGLAFRNVKKGYGIDKAVQLISIMKVYHRKYGYDEYFEYGLKVLGAYYLQNKLYLSDDLQKDLSTLLDLSTNRFPDMEAGVKEMNNHFLAPDVFKEFVISRHSVRQFSKRNIENDVLADAISIAQYSPSACNRQSIHVHIVSNKTLMESALLLQSGNRGFGNEFNKLIIITANINFYGSSNERNLCYVDGGIFTMTLLLSLHSLGVSSCPLNWAVDYQNEIKLKKIVDIPKNEKVIVMIGIGYAETTTVVAKSWRKPIEHIHTIHS